MAVKKKTDNAVTPEPTATKAAVKEFAVKESLKNYSHVVVGSRLIPIVDGKISNVDEKDVKEFIV